MTAARTEGPEQDASTPRDPDEEPTMTTKQDPTP